MQLSDIRNEVRVRAGFDDGDPFASNSVLNILINASLRSINGKADWDWRKATETINTVAGQTSYAVNSRAVSSVRVEDTSVRNELTMINPDAATEYKRLEGRPHYWYIEAGQLNVVPTPQDVRALEHTYLRSEETLVNDSDAPLIPDDMIDLVILRTAVSLLSRSDDQSQRGALYAEYRTLLDDVMRNVRRAKGSPKSRSRRDWSSLI